MFVVLRDGKQKVAAA